MFAIAQANEQMKNVPQRVVDYAWDVVKREGGYVDNPNDPGGATNHGISLRYAREQGTLFDLNHDGQVDATDIHQITPEMAVICFLMDFFIAPGFQNLPVGLQPEAMDFAVNSGDHEAELALQQCTNRLRNAKVGLSDQVPQLVEDGSVGPKTCTALASLVEALGEPAVVNAYTEMRESYLRDIVVRKPNMQEFLKGWIARAEQFREPV